MNGTVRGVIVGASTLLGKELAEELVSSAGAVWDLTLLDDSGSAGQMTSAGDEALVIQPVTPDAFDGADIVFFAGDAESSAKLFKAAQAAGASVVDLSGGLAGRPGMVLRSPWISDGAPIDLSTVGIVSANAAALMLAVVAERVARGAGPARMFATVLQPASEQGSAGIDELHQQTVGLLSFQAVPKNLYDAQVAFSVRASCGEAAKVDLGKLRGEIVREFGALLGAGSKVPLLLQLLQAPVFHGFTASVLVQCAEAVDMEALRDALDGGVVRVVEESEESPSNESAAAQTQVLLGLEAADGTEAKGREFWLWMAADNLRLATHHAAACAAELMALRPKGNLQ
jgi:aspartate-semialdehyde dehydrogenase